MLVVVGAGRLAASLVLAAVVALVAPSPAAADWDAVARVPGPAIEGYASQVSVLPRKPLKLHVSTSPAQRYRVVFYRVGWYPEAAPPALGCSPSCEGSVAGVARPVPAPAASTGKVDAGWPVTDTFTVPADWSSGYYVAKLLLTSGPNANKGNLVPFIVRARPGDRSAILVQASAATWQAYNGWGGKNLYPKGSTGGVPATHVSFNRPYARVGVGGQSLFDFEIQLARFLEREGYDVAYTTDVDVARDPSSLLGHELDIVAGHDEYWPREQRDAYEAARDAGVNLAFMGSNIGFWQIRYADDHRTIVGYKDHARDPFADRTQETVRFRDLDRPRPECELLGVQGHGGLSSALIDYTVQGASLGHPWFRGTGFAAGDRIGLVGYEWDGVHPGCSTPPLQVFFHLQTASGVNNADATVYTASSGARMFAAGSLKYTWGLDGYGQAAGHTDPRLQQFTRNQLDDLAGPDARRRSAQGRRDTRPPVVSITAPRRDQRLRPAHGGYRLRGRASDPSGVGRVELALERVNRGTRQCRYFNGKRTLQRRACNEPTFFAARLRGNSWSFWLSPRAKLPRGSYDLRVRATDRAGNRNAQYARSLRQLVRFKIR